MTYYKQRLEFDITDGLYLKDGIDSYPNCVILPNGQSLCDRFIIKKLLYPGYQCITYLAEDMLNETDVVIKTVDIGAHQRKAPGMLLKLEMDIYKMISSPNILRAYDLHSADIGGTSLLILSMEYFGGQTFRQWLSGRMDNDLFRQKGLEWFKKICQGIGAAHDSQVIHLNINPENIFIKNEQLKITGFGVSNFARIKMEDEGLNIESILKESNPVYMSPELFNSPHPDELTPSTDIYSLGILLYEILHPKRHPPFTGTYQALRDFHINVPFKRIESIDSKLSDIIARCLEKSPEKRYQTAWDLLDAIENRSLETTQKEEASDCATQEDRTDVKLQEVLRYCDEKKFNEATRLTNEILIHSPEHNSCLQIKNWLKKKYNQAEQLYEEIKQGLESEKMSLNLLLGSIKQAMSIFPDHPSGVYLQHKVLILSQSYKTSMEKGNQAVQSLNWQEAICFFEQACRIEAGSGVLKTRIEQLQKIKSMKDEIDENIKKGDFNKARRVAHLADIAIEQIMHLNV